LEDLKALVLAGGRGTRLKVIKDVPKPMAPVGGKPFLEYHIELLKKFNIRKIILSVGFKADVISEYFKDGSRLSVQIEYSKENLPLGTGGAIKKALPFLGNQFLVLNGDSIILSDLTAFINFHENKNSGQSILLTKVYNSSRYGNVVIDKNNQIVKFSEKDVKSNNGFINAGVYLIEKNSIDWKNMRGSFSLEKDLFPSLVEKGKLYGFPVDGFFIDIGMPEDYDKVQKTFWKINQYLSR